MIKLENPLHSTRKTLCFYGAVCKKKMYVCTLSYAKKFVRDIWEPQPPGKFLPSYRAEFVVRWMPEMRPARISCAHLLLQTVCEFFLSTSISRYLFEFPNFAASLDMFEFQLEHCLPYNNISSFWLFSKQTKGKEKARQRQRQR